MSELDHKEGWAPTNWLFWTVMLEKTLESSLNSKEIKPVNPKGNQPWIFIGRIDAEAEAPIPWPPDAKSQLTGKDPDAGKDWRQKRVTEDEMVGWHHQFNGHELGQTLGDGKGQEGLACCSPWSHKESDTTEQLNWTGLIQQVSLLCSPLSSRVCSNSCPLSQWCYLTFSSSDTHFSFCLQSFPASGSFPMIQPFESGGQRIGASASAWVLAMNIQDWFPLGLTGLISLQS